MVTMSFIGYASGSLALGGLSFILTTADSLSFVCIFIMIAGSFLNFIVLKEPPRYLFKKGKISEGFKSLSHISKVNKTGLKDNQILKIMDYPFEVTPNSSPYEKNISLKITEKSKSIFDAIKPLLNKDSLYSIVGLLSMSSLLYIVFYVSSVSVSDSLGLGKIQYNEMLLGLTHITGYALMIPTLHKLKRVKAEKIMLLIDFILGGTLLVITIFKFDRKGGFLEGTPYKIINITAAIIINIINSAFFCVFFAHAAELFDVRVRGIGVGFATLAGKLMGSFSPQIIDFGKKHALNTMGLSVVPVIIALPLVLGMRETLVEKSEGGEDDGEFESSG